VLREQQMSARFENALHLDHRRERIWDQAQRPGRHDSVEDRVGKWEVFGGGSQQPCRYGRIRNSLPRRWSSTREGSMAQTPSTAEP
jgi:hypothetical protein